MSWAAFDGAAPDLAAAAHRLIFRSGDGSVLLATVRGDDLPRIHPVNVAIVDGRLYVFVIAKSPKRGDLEADGRFALHTHQDPAAPDEFSIRGRARAVDDAATRAAVGDAWFFDVDDSYLLVELDVEQAVLGQRGADEWPPRYRRWTATGGR